MLDSGFSVKIDSVYSRYREMEAGVPQGAVLSQFLYNIYVSDPPRSQRTSLALYADDTAIMTRYMQEE